MALFQCLFCFRLRHPHEEDVSQGGKGYGDEYGQLQDWLHSGKPGTRLYLRGNRNSRVVSFATFPNVSNCGAQEHGDFWQQESLN